MRKLFLLLALLWGATSYAQVTVTGTVTDANSQAFANGTYQFTFATAAGIPGPYSFNGANFPVSTTYSGSLDSSGAFSQAMAPNNQITPSGSQWILRFCPAADAPCYQTQLAINGAGSITSSLTPPAIQVQAGLLNQPKAYADSEITSPVVGFVYYNLTSGALRVCTVSVPCTWVAVATGAAGVSSVFTRTGAVTAQSGDYTANLIPSGTFPTGVAAVTQTAADNSTKLATTAYVDNDFPGILAGTNSNVGLFNWSQTGVFTNAAQNDYLSVVINGGNDPSTVCNPLNVLNSGGTTFKFTDAIVGLVCVPPGSTGVTNAYSNGVLGQAWVVNTGATGQFGWVGGVGVSGQGACAANNAHCWGMNQGASDLASQTGNVVIGDEVDVKTNNTSTTGFGILLNYRGNGQPTSDNFPAVALTAPAGTATFTSGFECQSGSLASTLNCLSIGQVATGLTQSSQAVTWNASNGSAGFTEGWQLQRQGLMLFQGSPIWQNQPSAAESYPFSFTSTSALTVNQLVKIDTAHADSVVVCTTTDTICSGFVAVSDSTLCGSSSTTCPIATSPGSKVLGILGTGTCAIGNWVIVDTTTNGRVKCATVQPPAWQGFALAADSSVGTTFDVLVSPGGASNVNAKTFSTATNCAAVGTAANPSVASCAAAPAGQFSCATNASTGTCTVNTTAVTANSEIFVLESDTTVTGTRLGVTCNTSTTVNPATRLLASSVAATSFTINLGTITTNPACFSYWIIN
jgi:hypothetical protein